MFCDRLRACRMARGVTLQETADAIDVSLRTYQKYEGGNVYPDFAHLVGIADFLKVPTDFLLERDDYLESLGVYVDVPREGPPRRPKSHKHHCSPRPRSADNTED